VNEDLRRFVGIGHLRPGVTAAGVIVCDERFWVVVGVDVDGSLVPFAWDRQEGGWARCYDCPPEHEELGPLPDEVWRRLWPSGSEEQR
jgi:hypothetical protein